MLAALTLVSATLAQRVNSPAADALFDKAVAAMKANKFDEACPAFAESHRLDPRPGTLFARAECEAKAQKPATASALFSDYLQAARDLPAAQQAKHKERMQLAEERKKTLASQIAWLTLSLPKSTEGVEVTLDGTRLEGPSLGLALPVDPGEHVVSTKAKGGEHEERVTVAKGEKRSLTLSVRTGKPKRSTVDDDPDEPPPAASSAAASTSAVVPSAASSARTAPSKTGVMVAGGIGAAGVVVGIVAGALVFKNRSDVTAHCQGNRCDSTGKDAADAAKPLAMISNVGFGVGIIGIATAVWLATSDEPTAKASKGRPPLTVGGGPTPHGGGLSLSGAF